MSQLPFLEQLDAADDEQGVRERLATGSYNPRNAAIAKEWLRRKEAVRDSEAAARAEAREEEALSISRRALVISERAQKWAIAAVVVSSTTAIIVTIIQIMWQPR